MCCSRSLSHLWVVVLLVMMATGCGDGQLEVKRGDDAGLDTSQPDDTGQPDDTEPQFSCDDGVQNGDETDVDCGGPDCAACDDNRSCQAHSDCQSDQCQQGTCVSTSCDAVSCPTGESCYRGVCYRRCEADSECNDDKACIENSCVDPCDQVDCDTNTTCYRGVCYDTCDAQAECGDESRCESGGCVPVDCGGVACRDDETCYFGGCLDQCSSEADCSETGAVCESNACLVPTCDDGVKNGRETGVDCGGLDCDGCPTGRACNDNSDCLSDDCDAGTCAGQCDQSACEADNGWYDDGSTYECCDGERACGTCQDQEYRTYACDGSTCSFTVTDTQTVRDDCRDCPTGEVCGGGVCPSDSCTCSGADNECGCSSCTDCTASDGWYDVGSSSSCCDGGQACDCQEQEYRSYSCDGSSCTYSVTDNRTTTSNCNSCSDGDSCTDSYCSGGSCQHDAYCSGSDSQCGCSNCSDCTDDDGWYNDGGTYDCCDGGQACTCQDQEYRSYSCSGNSCSYNITDTRTQTSGCNSCNDGDSCTNSYCSGGSCQNDANCSGSDSQCGCASCSDCTADDGWYDDGGTYDCCDGDQTCTCQDEQYRSYSCSGTSCDYSVTDNRTQKSGCSSCDDGSECTSNSCVNGTCQALQHADGSDCGTCQECQSGTCSGAIGSTCNGDYCCYDDSADDFYCTSTLPGNHVCYQ